MSGTEAGNDPLQGHVDRKLLQSFSRLLGGETFATIVAEVESDLDLYTKEVVALTGSSDSVPIRKLLHRLDGFAKQFGFARLASFSSMGLKMQGEDSKAMLPDCASELAFLTEHKSVIFSGL